MLSQHTETMETAPSMDTFHKLADIWVLWAHLPHNTDWSPKSYINIASFTTLEEAIAITESLPAILIENCMLFIMKKGIKPTWEDEHNRNGGCFSYRVPEKSIVDAWKGLTYRVVGGSVSNGAAFVKSVTGITISPKKKFSIIKVWMTNCDHQNPATIAPVKGLQAQGCLFKKHTPEY